MGWIKRFHNDFVYVTFQTNMRQQEFYRDHKCPIYRCPGHKNCKLFDLERGTDSKNEMYAKREQTVYKVLWAKENLGTEKH